MDRPRVVIVGAGFAGLWAARALGHAPVDVLLLDRNNYHTFFPLLYQVAAAELEPESIVYPVRSLLRGQRNVRFLMEEVVRIDLSARTVTTARQEFAYDYLVMALGSAPAFYGVAGAAEHTFQLKSLDQAVILRSHILSCFERALSESDPAVREKLLTFIIVGGGPTGVEFSGALSELIHGPLRRDFPELASSQTKVVLLEATARLLPTFPERLGVYAARRLGKMKVNVSLNTVVDNVLPQSVCLKDGTTLSAGTIIWTAGVRGRPFDASLPARPNGQVDILPTLQSPDHAEVYMIGDVARLEQAGHPLPMVGPVATQQGRAAARNILLQVQGLAPRTFHYRNNGLMATIGRNAAVAYVWGQAFAGFPAWLLWLFIHLYGLIGFRNRLLVLIDWAWDYLFYERAVKLIASLGV